MAATTSDFGDVIDLLGPSDLQNLYIALGLQYQDIEKAEVGANTNSVSLKARAVLRFWRQINGQAATREAILAGLEECKNRSAREELAEKWNMTQVSNSDKQGQQVHDHDPRPIDAAVSNPDSTDAAGQSDTPIVQEKLLYNDLKFTGKKLGQGEHPVLHVTFKRGSFKGYKQAAAKYASDKERLAEEVDIMKDLDHPNIVRFLDFVEGPPPNAPGYPHPYYIIMEVGDLSLYKYLESLAPGVVVGRPLQNKWALEATQAISYLHENNIVHRDIKPENCIIFTGQVLKVGDFGISRQADRTKRTTNQRGTYMYTAPEVREHKLFSKASDIWALAFLLWHIYASNKDDDFTSPPPMRENFPESIKELLPKCWQHDRRERPKIEEVLNIVTNG